MSSSLPSRVKKRELTIFDLPPIGTAKFPSRFKRPTVTVYQSLNLADGSDGDVKNTKTKIASHKAHLRLRELTETSLDKTPTDYELRKIAFNYLNRPTSTDSWFRKKQILHHVTPKTKDPKQNVRDAFTQMAIFPPLTSRGDPILRRPTVLSSKPVSEGGDVFRLIIRGKELKPFSFQGDLKMTRDFYASHFPLLMCKISEAFHVDPNSERGTTAVTEELAREYVRHSSAERRSMRIREKGRILEELLKELEDNDEDGIITELRNDVFNPLLWPWNRDK